MIYKFRGQVRRKGEKVRLDGSPVKSKWVYGGLCQGKERSVIYGGEFEDVHNKHVVYSDTVGQYIGVKDKDENEIYHGDILDISEYPFESNGEKNYFGIVMWCSHSLSFYIYAQKYKASHVSGIAEGNSYSFSDFETNQIKIVGNVYDDKELLEKGEI